ncbi:CoA transferase [Marinovum sp. SP66]|uniref:CaiB/BaiF CoA transferase family protein n=1 Tax=Marinovum sp. SP66 TaxID=3028379 RepID=UPI00237A7A1D|nr:CoA transferase [Marinovum sp. SP66]MDD9739791.1 CoA transferase [Marinovum sp. SP66]
MIDLLKGVRVVEMTTIVLGPMAGQILADFGADVIKVEALDGDLARYVEPRSPHGDSSMFANSNRNKRSIAIDLKSDEGAAAMRRLIASADVFFHNMRLGAVKRLGLDPNSLRQLNPRLIYCSAIGFGSSGPYADRPAYDDVIQAASGLAWLPTYAGAEPAYVPGVMADKVAALYAAQAISAALFGREKNGAGMEIEVPMFEVMASFVMTEHLAAATFSEDGRPGYGRLLNKHRKPFRSSDGWIAVLPYTGAHWLRTFIEIGREDVTKAHWFANPSERSLRVGDMYAILAEEMTKRTTDEWVSTFERIDVPHSRVNSLMDLLEDPHLANSDFFRAVDDLPGRARSVPQPVAFRGAETRPDTPPPSLGEHGALILEELGFTPPEISALVDQGILQATRK